MRVPTTVKPRSSSRSVIPAVVVLLLALVQFALVARDELLVVHAAREAGARGERRGIGLDRRGTRAARRERRGVRWCAGR